jgi:hypothetical protein
VWAKVKIVAEIDSDSDGDNLVREVCSEMVSITTLKTAQLGNLLDPELTIVIPEKIEIHDDDHQTTYFRDIDISEWADDVFGGVL